MSTVQKLVDIFLDYLGSYSGDEYFVHLYDVPQNLVPNIVKIIQEECSNRCSILIVHPDEPLTNIYITDIDL